MIQHLGKKWVVTDSSGERILGNHESKREAIKQLQAIEISKKERQQDENRLMSFSTFIQENA